MERLGGSPFRARVLREGARILDVGLVALNPKPFFHWCLRTCGSTEFLSPDGKFRVHETSTINPKPYAINPKSASASFGCCF